MTQKLKKIFIVFILLIFNNAIAQTIHCPPNLDLGKETKFPHWIINNVQQDKKPSPAADFSKIFIGSAILEGHPGEEQAAYPTLLAPDQEIKKDGKIIQLWHLRSNQPILLICRYRNSDAYLSTALPKNISVCKQFLTLVNPKSHVPSGAIATRLECSAN